MNPGETHIENHGCCKKLVERLHATFLFLLFLRRHLLLSTQRGFTSEVKVRQCRTVTERFKMVRTNNPNVPNFVIYIKIIVGNGYTYWQTQHDNICLNVPTRPAK